MDAGVDLNVAQQRLDELRLAHRARRRLCNLRESQSSSLPLAKCLQLLPPHLGWGTFRPIRSIHHRENKKSPSTQDCLPPPPTDFRPKPAPTTIKLHPDIGLAMLRHESVAPGRIWLLLRHIDENGRGWVSQAEAREHLTRKDALLRVCGRRQLRNLLRQGDGIFWQRDKERIWLRSTAKVAAALGLERLGGRSVAVPVSALCQTMGTVRAHLYASFHSGREARPIARGTMQLLSGVSSNSQRQYERLCGVKIRPNFAILAPFSAESHQETAWQHGNATFTFIDRDGKHGRPGASYIARRLPNSYTGTHVRLSKGNLKRLNQKLGGLAHIGTPGNSRTASEHKRTSLERRYFNDGVSASRNGGYWRGLDDRFWYPTGNYLRPL